MKEIFYLLNSSRELLQELIQEGGLPRPLHTQCAALENELGTFLDGLGLPSIAAPNPITEPPLQNGN